MELKFVKNNKRDIRLGNQVSWLRARLEGGMHSLLAPSECCMVAQDCSIGTPDGRLSWNQEFKISLGDILGQSLVIQHSNMKP